MPGCTPVMALTVMNQIDVGICAHGTPSEGDRLLMSHQVNTQTSAMKEEATENLHMPGTALGMGDTAVNQTKKHALLALIF